MLATVPLCYSDSRHRAAIESSTCVGATWAR